MLEALGVKIDLPPDKVEKCLFETGFGFLFAPLFHPAMKYAIGPRREMGIRTIFNILGPITNPAGAKTGTRRLCRETHRAIGKSARNLGASDAMVVHGVDGLDEITLTDGTKVSRYKDNRVENFIISPEDFGIERGKLEDLVGADKMSNARITLSILNGEKGPKRNVVLMNSAAALVVAGKAKDFRGGAAIAAEAIDSGRAIKKLEEIKKVSNSL